MSNFMNQYNGPLTGLLKWQQLDKLTDFLTSSDDDQWYVYYVGETVPTEPLSSQLFNLFTTELAKLLRGDHQEDYLGIVYVDDIEQPSFVKIYDPNNLGSACGSSGMNVLPGWTISRSAPVDLQAQFPNPGGRRRWWNNLIS
ncbi:MAG: hypothetical protein OEL79_05535 [Chromatiales bacterium]|nr:hypothetical protein [Chromatiales bacterium]